MSVTLAAGSGLLDTWQRRIGFRTITLDTTADAAGTAFTLLVNGVPVFVRGVNWIPDDAFVTRVTRERYATRIGQALDAGVNYLRVWGGGRYESHDFYDLADEHGLLVGQDFLFACAAYPEEEPLATEIAAEAAHQVVRLMPHPSLVMWVGNNENLWGHEDWDWKTALAGRTWGAGYYYDVLPGIVTALDPTRPYWPGSPYSGNPDLHPNDPAHGTTHIWDVWNTHDYHHYRTYQPRFLADSDTGRALWFFAEDIDLLYPPAQVDVDVHPTTDGATVEVTARTFVRDLTLFADRLDPTADVDHQLITLLPGETATLRVTGTALPAPDDPAWRTTPALRTANDLITR